MKNLTIIGALLVLVSGAMRNTLGTSTTWMFLAGLILLVGALVIFSSRKRKILKNSSLLKVVEIGSLVLMLSLTILGLEVWDAHPLGFIIALAGCIWVFYHNFKKQVFIQQENTVHWRNPFREQPWLKYAKWLSIPLSILLMLWMFQSIWLSFAVGIILTSILDWYSLKTRGLNRVLAILLIYSIGFFFLLLLATKIQQATYGCTQFFSSHTYIRLREMMRY